MPKSYSILLSTIPLCAAILLAAPEKDSPGNDENTGDPALAEGRLMSGIRQLTFEGQRAGEGYFSADGSKMVFQSEREEGNPFYQIYLLDLESGDLERISTGTGKTTCAWMHPDGNRVLFASTQDDPEAAAKQEAEIQERESGKARKYSWDYDSAFEIYDYDREKKTYRNLTRTEGYDAEGAYSPDGSRIVFASNRHAYSEKLSKEDAVLFRLDKKFPMELYLMDADGSNVRRLTNADGYDGGPFFSADGKQICWRRFDRKGLTAEIFAMNADGGGERQLTRMGVMSWAPFFHPSGEYLIFATNKHGFDNFELYLVDAAGAGEPVRVTHTPGFDGLPAFSPDGKQLSWTSNRTASKQSQIFLANWDHEAARALLGTGAAKETAPGASPRRPDFSPTAEEIREEDLKRHLEYLASDELAGRLTGTPGEQEATAYAASVFERIGLEPAGDDGGWFQPFEFTAGVAVGAGNRLTLDLGDGPVEGLKVDEDWRPISFSKTGKFDPGGIVFAGYGLEMPPANGEDEAYTSYFHLDVKGKWVMMFRFSPEDAPKEKRMEFQRYSGLRHKAMIARRKFAAGVIFVSGPNSKAREELVPMQFDASLADSGIPAISIGTALAEKILAAAGKDLKALQTELDGGGMVAGFPVRGAKLGAEIDVDQETRTGRNVLARLSAEKGIASGTPAVLIGAHIDHLGDQAGPGSLARENEKDQIHHGADDNASGIAALLEIAQYLKGRQKAGQLPLKRDLVFAAWSGEELGLLGSSHFVKKIGHEKNGDANGGLAEHFAACLNMDMVGRLGKTLLLQGIGSSDYWTGAIERRNAPIGLAVKTQQDVYLPTDATTFYLKKVPILSAFTGSHEDYHTPRDTSDKINYPGLRDIAKLMALIARGIATEDQGPVYVKVDPPKNQGMRGFRVYLGTIPDYSEGDIRGVKLSGVAGEGPAAKAGVQGGDTIVGLAGKEILNIYDYTAVLAEMKIGEETDIAVLRDGKKLTLKIVPGSRE